MSKINMGKGQSTANKNGKANKKVENKKAEKNSEIESIIMKYYLTEAEMPQYVANIAKSIDKQYAGQMAQMAAHIGLITGNMQMMAKAVKASKLSKGSQSEILQWVEMFNTDKEAK